MTYSKLITRAQETQWNSTLLYEASLTFSGVYLLHAHEKLHHAQHYLGYSNNIASRIAAHRKSEGSKLVKAFNLNGITWEVARIWKGETRDFERQLHNGKNSAKWLCPICSQKRIAEKLQLTALFNEPIATYDLLHLTEERLLEVEPC